MGILYLFQICRDRMVVGFIAQVAISAYHLLSCEFEPRSWRGVFDTTLCDKVCQWLATGQWFSPGTPASSTNKTDRHDIAVILLKVALNTINQPSRQTGSRNLMGPKTLPTIWGTYSTERDIPWLITPRDIIFNPLDISSRTHCDRPKKDHKTRWWGLNFMALGHLCADWYFTAN